MEFEDLMQKLTSSTDIDEVHACQKEIQSRISSYVQRKEDILVKGSRSPINQPKHRNHSQPSRTNGNIPVHVKRCFKTPLLNKNGYNVGWWYGQFDNQNIVKQMEVYTNQPPVFLRAGFDDKLMCNLQLHKTGLEKIEDAEISYGEFAKQWNSLGGKPIIFL